MKHQRPRSSMPNLPRGLRQGVKSKLRAVLTYDGRDDVPPLQAGLDGGPADLVVDLLDHALGNF